MSDEIVEVVEANAPDLMCLTPEGFYDTIKARVKAHGDGVGSIIEETSAFLEEHDLDPSEAKMLFSKTLVDEIRAEAKKTHRLKNERASRSIMNILS